MIGKPETRSGYNGGQLDRVRQTCLYIATKLGDLLDEIVVVGGLVPHLLIDQENRPLGTDAHAGTMDLDLGIALAMLGEQRYREVATRLRDAGFEPDVNAGGNPTLQRWTINTGRPVTVDFLIPPIDEADQAGTIRPLEHDFGAVITPGLELAFRDQRRTEIADVIPSGARATRSIPVCGPGAFTVLKALAFGERTATKDAYDLFYVWRGLGLPAVAERLLSLMPNPNVKQALAVIERDFGSLDAPGPVAAARFMTGRLDDEIQADVSGLALALLDSVRKV